MGLCVKLPEFIVLAVDGFLDGFNSGPGDRLEVNSAVEAFGSLGPPKVDHRALTGGGGLIGVFVSVIVGRVLLIEGGLMKGLGVEIVVVPGEGVAYGDEDIEDGR